MTVVAHGSGKKEETALSDMAFWRPVRGNVTATRKLKDCGFETDKV